MALKILVVGTAASVHTGRFVQLLQRCGYAVRVFNHSLDYAEDEHLRRTIIYALGPRPSIADNIMVPWPSSPLAKALLRFKRWSLARQAAPRRLNERTVLQPAEMRPAIGVAGVVMSWRPDLVISLKMQEDGYTAARARAILGDWFPPWLHFNWGTDIAHFALDPHEAPHHERLVRAVLGMCDFHIADCERDVRLATAFGLKGESLGACLATGGFDMKELQAAREAVKGPRTQVLVKARHWPPVGVAATILDALEGMVSFGPLRFKFVMCTPDMAERVRARAAEGAPFDVAGRVQYRDLLAEFARSRFTISATTVDGSPLFLAETIALGSMPVHSDLESVREWVEHNRNGLLFEPHDSRGLRSQIERAVADDALIIEASRLNLQIAAARMDSAKLGEHLKDLIENRILARKDLQERRRQAGSV